ncbi:hypothetical protein GHT06_004666 [Daphnia sinensis]|uniref:Uncharacterized protein n=1 Tax=Daphnia sinensis TaxID=1820382 RepID=A0AAD5PN89_9CRUS|nr:hypothetical protein GHT06_005410 [Daphnia sinensis]KAI9550856.1 hypothetical protein GHT06_004666 [Daphnia sinensis]
MQNDFGKTESLFTYQQPERSKRHLLGINSHLLQSIKRGLGSGHQLWFSDYLNTNSMDGDEGYAQVTLLCRVVRRTETLDLDLLRSKKGEYQLRSVDMGATHVIQEVVYGAEVICSMRKALDLSQETKKSAESSIYLEAKKYLNRTITKSTSLDQVSCTVLSSIEPGKKNEMDFMSLKSFLKDLLYTDFQQNWKPMEFLLQNISATNIEAQLRSERKGDIALEKEHHHVTRKWITQEMQDISNDPLLKRFPLLEKFVCYFRDLLPHFWKKIDEAYQTLEMFPDEKALEEMIYISVWLKEIIDWHADRRKDIQEICWLLKDTDLVLLNKQEIEAEMAKSNCKIAKLFVLNVEHKQVPIVNDIGKFVGRKTTTALLPVLPVFSYEKERIECVRTALSKFADEAKVATSVNGTNYHMGFYCSTLNDAAVVTVDSSDKSSLILTSVDSPVEYLKIKKKLRLPARSFSVSSSSNSLLTPTVVSNPNRKLKTEKASERFNPNTHFAANSTAKLKDNKKSAINIKTFNSDVDTRFVGYSRHTTDSTKTKSWMQQVQSPATAVSRNDQTGVGSKANRHSLQFGQLNLGDASAQKKRTFVANLAAQFQKTVASDHQTTIRSISRKEQIGTGAESDKPNLRF